VACKLLNPEYLFVQLVRFTDLDKRTGESTQAGLTFHIRETVYVRKEGDAP